MNQNQFTRRQALQVGGAALCTAAFVRPLRAADTKPKKILYFTKSSGFQHSVVQRPEGQLSHSEKILVEMGKKHGFDITPSKDGRIFDGDHEQFDAYVFYTSGDLTKVGSDKAPAMSKGGKQALLDAVNGGKGFLGIHAATDTFRGGREIDPYVKMIGGEFVGHGAQQKARNTVVDAGFPGMDGLGDGFELHEEWYALKNFAPDMHVLLVQETGGMEGKDYQRTPFPATWARMQSKGPVYYTSLGHREDVWTNPLFEKIVVGGLNWVTGIETAEVPANIGEVTPGANEMSK